jgi:hypothetical protein
VRSPTLTLALVGAALGACGPSAPVPHVSVNAPAPSAADERSTTERPPYGAVVTIVVDQLAAWVLSERISELPADGGFARLRREGTYVPDLRYDFAITETAPGHSALYTGASPRESGIIGNELTDAAGKTRSIVRDEGTSLIGASGALQRRGNSLSDLRVETLADVLRRARPNSQIVSISYKDRGSVFGGGRKPNASVWFDAETKGFVTSSAFASELPGFAKVAPPALPATWNPFDAAWLALHAKTADAQDGEADVAGLGTTFPHTVESLEARRPTPMLDEDLFALALAAVAGSERKKPLLLALSLSGNDYVGHAFGPDSWEAWDSLRRLDALLARFLRVLDQSFGANGYALVLSGDHGIVPLPEVTLARRVRADCAERADPWQRPCGAAGRVAIHATLERLENEARRALGGGRWLLGYFDPYLYFNAEGRALPPARRATLVAAVTNVLLGEAGVARVVDVAALPASCPQSDDIDALVCRSVAPGRGGDLYLVSKPGYFFLDKPRPRGTTHGTPYLYDRAVPLMVRAPGRAPANRVVNEPLDFRAFSRTAATLLDIEAPSAARPGRDLGAPGDAP